MFKHLTLVKAALSYIFSKKARFAGKFDERDLLLGHGIDNLSSIRVVLAVSLAIAIYLLVNFLLSNNIVSALLFILIMEVLCFYSSHLPRSGMEQTIHNSFEKINKKRSYRSYLNGRILFTPYGISLSFKARNAQSISKERHEQAKQVLNLINDNNKDTSYFGILSFLLKSLSTINKINSKIRFNSFAKLTSSQINQGLNKAQSEHNARLYLSGRGHKSAAMILQSGVSVDDYVIAQGILASTSDSNDLPVANSGYITKVPVPLLCDQRIYAGKSITMEAIAQILCACALQESDKQKRTFIPTDLCLLGFGFEWLPKHSRALRQIMAVGAKAAPLGGDGSPDIHALEVDHAYEPIVTSTTKLKGHTLLLGTTGSGKTRFFDLLVSQAIMRGDTVIVLDPKGDRDLQRSIIKAARAAEREPYQDLVCLDIGRAVSNPLSSTSAIDYAASSTGSLKQFAMDSYNIVDKSNIDPISPFERSRNNLTTQGYLSLINEDFTERLGEDQLFTSNNNDKTNNRRVINYRQRKYLKGYNESFASIRASNYRYSDPNFAIVMNNDPDDRLFDEINFGINPTSVFDRASEVASRLTSMVGGQGSSANFKAYAAMAITAAVECCRLLDENVTLDAIRGYIANHQKFILAIRDIINKTVVNLNNVYCSHYYNRIYGIRDQQLVKNAYTISVLMANGYKYINLKERATVLAVLEKSGLLDLSDELIEDSEKLQQIENIIDNQSLTKEILSSNSKASSNGSTKNTQSKPRYLAAPAPIKALQEFYLWLTKSGYLDRDNSIEQIFEVCFMDPIFFQKVTNSIMPSLVSLTSGVLKQLLSSDDYKQTNFMEIVRNNKIFYSALHCLKDSITGQNLGKLLMADLAYVAGEINAKNIHGHRQVSVFIDEASELSNEVLVQLLNKSRASNFAVTIATQSVADLRARVNSKDAAEQIIANCNNLLSLRVEDVDTANVIAKVLPNTVCSHESTTISVNSGGLTGSSSASRTLNQQDCEYFPATMLMQLPNFEFIARLANGSCYKGFIPIIDKENSGHLRPSFDKVDDAQKFAHQQNKRMRDKTYNKAQDSVSNQAQAKDKISASKDAFSPVLDSKVNNETKNTCSIKSAIAHEQFDNKAQQALNLAKHIVDLGPNIDPQRQRFDNYIKARRKAHELEALKDLARANAYEGGANVLDVNNCNNYCSDIPAYYQKSLNINSSSSSSSSSSSNDSSKEHNIIKNSLDLNNHHHQCLTNTIGTEQAYDKASAQAIGAKLNEYFSDHNLNNKTIALLMGVDNQDAINSSLNDSYANSDGPNISLSGYDVGFSKEQLNQETKVYVGNEQNLLYRHFEDSDFKNFSNDYRSISSAMVKTDEILANYNDKKCHQDKSLHQDHNKQLPNKEQALMDKLLTNNLAISTNDKSQEGLLNQKASDTFESMLQASKKRHVTKANMIKSPKGNYSPAPILLSAFNDSKSKINRNYQQASSLSQQEDKAHYYDPWKLKNELYQEYGLIGLIVWLLRVLFYPCEYLLKMMLTLMLNEAFLKHLAIIKELMLVLMLLFLTAVLFNHDKLSYLAANVSDLGLYIHDLVAVSYYALFNGLDDINQALYQDSSLIDRLKLYAQLVIDYNQCALCCFALGLLLGNHYGLVSEMHHRSLLGLRTLLRPYSFLNLSLSISALALLIGGIFPCIEYALLITWLKVALYGFTLSCFYSQHTK